MNPRELLQFVSDEGIKMVDLRFVDLPGLWQHFSISANEIEEEMFEEGVGFDGSSIRGFQEIQESDMILIPDASTAFKDPFTAVPTLNIICNVKDPVTLQSYTRDPRHIAQKAENYLKSTGIGDTAYFGPEPEFFVLDDIRFDQSYNYGYYYVDSQGRILEFRKRGESQPGLQAPLQGGLLSRSSHGQSSGHPQRNGSVAGGDRGPGGGSPPRGGNGRAV